VEPTVAAEPASDYINPPAEYGKPEAALTPAACDHVEASGRTNFWLTNSTLPASLHVDLGCVMQIESVLLKNTHNYKEDNFGTKVQLLNAWHQAQIEPLGLHRGAAAV
jgi:hypothetical protein